MNNLNFVIVFKNNSKYKSTFTYKNQQKVKSTKLVFTRLYTEIESTQQRFFKNSPFQSLQQKYWLNNFITSKNNFRWPKYCT